MQPQQNPHEPAKPSDEPQSQAEPKSADASARSDAELGEAQLVGAVPSNTAPTNSNKKENHTNFRLLRVAVDSLYLSFSGQMYESEHKKFEELKLNAQSKMHAIQQLAQVKIGDHIFEVKSKGAGLYAYILEDNAYRIQLTANKKVRMAYVKVSAEYLAHKDTREILTELKIILSEFGHLHSTNLVSRIDLAVDFVTDHDIGKLTQEAWITRAHRINKYYDNQKPTGWTIGLGGDIGARLYDKTIEIQHSNKEWVKLLWLPAGWDTEETVWRLEFEVKRAALDELGFSELGTILDSLGSLWHYLTDEWLRLCVPNVNDETRTRWPLHPLWIDLSQLDWSQTNSAKLKRFSNTRTPDIERLITLVHGVMTSFMAVHGIKDADQAAANLMQLSRTHYASVAANEDMTYAELIEQNVANKARRFNTAFNRKAPQNEAPDNLDNVKE